MRIIDLIRAAQGPGDHTFFDYALLQRREGNDQHQLKPYPINLGEALSSQLSSDDALLRPEDTLTIFSQNELSQVPTVSIRGEVRKPGSYPLTPGMSVRELVYGAGGLLENASRDRAELSRTEIANGAMAKYIHMDLDLRRALSAMDNQDVALQAGDELYVQQASNWHAPWHVDLEGQVMRPGPYPIREGERLSSVLEACGGFRPDAYPRAAIFIRQSVKQLQDQQLDQARSRLQQDIARLALAPKQAGQSDTGADTLVALKTVLSQADSQQAVGRMVIHISSISTLERSQDNVVLENADRLVIPTTPASVQVLGQVYNPNAIVYQPALTVQDYLQKAGGATDGGDAEHIYVVKSDGSVLTDQGVREAGKNRVFPLLPSVSGGLMGQRLEPGDTVYVPEKLLYISSLQYSKDVTQIVANAATGLAVLAILATTL
jgi:protein involved in polysaccharide export with SLBB domain